MRYILILLLLGSPAHADEFRHWSAWTAEEKRWYTLYNGASYLDYAQTRWALSQKDPHGVYIYREANPLLGTRPHQDSVLAIKLGMAALQYYAIGRIGFSNTTYASTFKTATLVQIGVVVHNNNIGISFSRVF
jgi:hypothetical protein